jgi:Pyridoxal-dependent decarboxylase, C-terminal sheet domain
VSDLFFGRTHPPSRSLSMPTTLDRTPRRDCLLCQRRRLRWFQRYPHVSRSCLSPSPWFSRIDCRLEQGRRRRRRRLCRQYCGIVRDGTLRFDRLCSDSCNSMDVIARRVLSPRLEVGDFVYFPNMGCLRRWQLAVAAAFQWMFALTQ